MSDFIKKILDEALEEKGVFPLDFLQKIEKWIKNDNYVESLAFDLKKYKDIIPIKCKKIPKFLYRYVFVDLNKEINFSSGVRSWCSSLKSAEFFSGFNEDFNEFDNYILRIVGDISRVICNLPLLVTEDIFKKSLQYYETKGIKFDINVDGVITENEVIYNQPSITKNDIFLKLKYEKDRWD